MLPAMSGFRHGRAGPPPVLSDYRGFAERTAARLRPPPPDRPLVSIITVCRNAAATLPATLASVAAQTHPAVEHIVIDGASTDGTEAILAAAGHLAGWISEPDAGISDAFNKGLALSRGEVIGILNADDAYVPEAAAAAVAALAADPQAAWTFADCDFTLDGRTVLHRAGDPDYATIIKRRMPVLNHPTVFVRRRAYERHGLFRTDLRLAMDYELLLRLHAAGEYGRRIPRTLVRMALGGASCRSILAAYAESAEIARHYGEPAWRATCTRIRMSTLPLLRMAAHASGAAWLWKSMRRRPPSPSLSRR